MTEKSKENYGNNTFKTPRVHLLTVLECNSYRCEFLLLFLEFFISPEHGQVLLRAKIRSTHTMSYLLKNIFLNQEKFTSCRDVKTHSVESVKHVC